MEFLTGVRLQLLQIQCMYFCQGINLLDFKCGVKFSCIF